MSRTSSSASAFFAGLALALHSALAPLGAQQSNTAADSTAIGTDTSVASSTGAQSRAAQPQKTFFTRRDAAWSGVALAASAGISIFDPRIAHWFQSPSVQGNSSRHDTFKSLTVVNEQPLTIGAFVVYGVGRLTHSSVVADVGLHATEALVLTVGVSEAIRGPLGRLRPRVSEDDQYDFKFWRGFTDFAGRSYPSLHSAVGFATASVLVSEMEERHSPATPYVAPVLYAAALVPGITRLYLNEHWASDVAAGAFVGTLLGSRVVHYAHSHKQSKLDHFLLGTSLLPDGHGGMLVMKTIQH